MTTAFEFNCPNCKRSIKASESYVGKKVKCPGCGQPFLVPSPPDDDEVPEPEDEYKVADWMDDIPPAAPPRAVEAPSEPTDTQAEWRPSSSVLSSHADHLPESRSYPALNIIRVLLLVQAGILAVAWVIMLILGVVAMLFAGGGEGGDGVAAAAGFSIFYLFSTFLGTAVAVCMLIAASELIKVVLDIQENTLAAAKK